MNDGRDSRRRTADSAGGRGAPSIFAALCRGPAMQISKAAIGLLLSTAIVGAKAPPPPPGTTDPQVGYVKILNNGVRELWVAREDGTGAVRLAATGVKSWMFFGLGGKSQGLVAYAIPGQLHLLHFVQGANGVKTDTDAVIVSNATSFAAAPAVSPTGDYVAWVGNVNGNGNGIHVYSVAAHSIVRNVISSSLSGFVDFSADGSKIIYTDILNPSDVSNVAFRSVPVSGGAPTDLGIQGRYGPFRVGPADEIVADSGTLNGSVWLFPSGATSPNLLTTNGLFPSLRCDSRVVIFERTGISGGLSILKYDIGTGLTSTFSMSGYYSPDYFPDC